MKVNQKANKNYVKEIKKLLAQLLIKAKTDIKVKNFLHDLELFLKREDLTAADFKVELNKLQEKHFPKFDKGESKND